MMGLSLTNLAWPAALVHKMAPRIKQVGIDGVEIAPTAIWPDAPHVPSSQVRRYAQHWREFDLAVSGIQSLLYGHLEFQIFDKNTWPDMREHLTSMIQIAYDLGTHVAVFGSPRNRRRGEINDAEANAICAEFLTSLLPVLANCGVVLALEPNAPAYGADYLTHYSDTIALSNLIDSPWVQPQIDSGCLFMVHDDPAQAVLTHVPVHVHVSTPNMLPPPGPVDHDALRKALMSSSYDGWVVLEMLQTTTNPVETAIESAQWLVDTYGSTRHDSTPH